MRTTIKESKAIRVSQVLNSDEIWDLVIAEMPYTFERIAIISEGRWAFGVSVVVVQDVDTGDIFVLTLVCKVGRDITNGN